MGNLKVSWSINHLDYVAVRLELGISETRCIDNIPQPGRGYAAINAKPHPPVRGVGGAEVGI